AHVRISNQAHISQQLQFEPVIMFLARTPRLMLPRSLMHRSCKARIAASTPPAPGNHHALIRPGKIEDLLAGFFVIHNRSHWNFQKYIYAFAARLVGTFAVTPALSFVLGIKAEMHQRVMALAGFHDHIPTFTAVAA